VNPNVKWDLVPYTIFFCNKLHVWQKAGFGMQMRRKTDVARERTLEGGNRRVGHKGGC
jgi:hypothetical protein